MHGYARNDPRALYSAMLFLGLLPNSLGRLPDEIKSGCETGPTELNQIGDGR
jgi:hypothetical protein